MSVNQQEFSEALAVFTSLCPVMTDANGHISAVSCNIEGIAGGSNASRRNNTVSYRVLVDVTDLAGSLPTVWVLSPKDAQIEHMNVFHDNRSAHCRLLEKQLPMLCWGNYGTMWGGRPKGQRKLLPFLELITQHLNHPNADSPARA
jgi:hypothetical protein